MDSLIDAKRVMARLGRFERPTSGSGDQRLHTKTPHFMRVLSYYCAQIVPTLE